MRDHNVLADHAGTVHVTFRHSDPDFVTNDILYLHKPADGEWLSARNVSETGDAFGAFGTIVDDEQAVHFAWHDNNAYRRGGFYRRLDADGVFSAKEHIFPCSLAMSAYPDLMIQGSADELELVVTGNHENQDWRYLALSVRPPDGVWSDTIVCGVTERDPYDIMLTEVVRSPLGVLHLFGSKTTDTANLNNKDVYWIEIDPRRRYR